MDALQESQLKFSKFSRISKTQLLDMPLNWGLLSGGNLLDKERVSLDFDIGDPTPSHCWVMSAKTVARGKTWTRDLQICSPALYLLSYAFAAIQRNNNLYILLFEPSNFITRLMYMISLNVLKIISAFNALVN